MLALRLLGRLVIELDGSPLAAPRAAAGRWLLAWLALHPGPQPRAALASRFWPDVLDDSARQSLRNALYGLRRDLGPAAAHVEVTGETIALTGAVRVDVRDLEEALERGDGDAVARLAEAGELLWGFDEDWAIAARDDWNDRIGAALAGLVAAAPPSEAIAWARLRLRLDPLSEEAARALMNALAGAGDRAAAVTVFERLAERLRRELRMAPSAATRELVDGLRNAPSDLRPGGAQPTEAEPPAREAAQSHPALTRALPLIGRGAELAALVGDWSAARSGRGGAVIVTGDAGMGKTRLSAELAARAAADGARVALGAGVALETAAPLAPWAELLDALLETHADASWSAPLARLVPRLGTPAVDVDRLALHEAVVAAVSDAAAAAPLLLVFEDAHFSDEASLALLAHLGRRLHAIRVLLLITTRPGTPAALDAATDSLQAAGTLRARITLAPLRDVDVRMLVAHAAASLDGEAIHRAADAAEGNPLLAVEGARALERGHEGSPPPLLLTVGGLLRGLSEDGRRVAHTLAVAGRPLEPAELAALPVAAPGLAAAEGCASGLLAGEAALDFRHALLRDAAYELLEPPYRLALHEHVADLLIETGARRPAEVAHHLRRAGRDDRAVEHLAAAARAARDVAALSEARAFVCAALELRPQDPQLWHLLAHIEALRGRHDEMLEASRAGLERLSPGDNRARGLALLDRGLWLSSALCWPLEALVDLRAAERALAHEPDLAPERAELLAATAWAEAVAGDPERVEPLLTAVQEAGGDGMPAVHAVSARANALVRQGRPKEALALAGDLDSAIRAGTTPLRLGDTVWLELASIAAYAGEHERSLELVHRFLSVSGALPPKRIEGLAALAYVLVRLGRADEAVAAAEEMVAVAEEIGDDELPALARHDLGFVLCQVDEHERGVALLALSLQQGAKVALGAARLRRAESLVALDRLEEAAAELRRAVLAPHRPADQPATLVPRVARVQGLIARARGDRDEALRRFDEAIAGWTALRGDDRKHAYMSNLVDLGRPPVAGLTEPEPELARVRAEREECSAWSASTTTP